MNSHIQSISKHYFFISILCAVLLSLVFVWTRLYQLPVNIDFFNDIGRDFMVLFNWQQTWKPPLLGPQMSVIPFNQSAVYFYVLFPMFVFTSHSVISSTLTVTLFYLLLFWMGIIVFRHRPLLIRSLLFVAFIFISHPQFIIQQRFVWNPSFVAACIATSVYALLLIREKYSRLRALTFTFSLAMAVGFSFSALPAAFVIFVYSLFLAKSKRLQLIFMALASGFLVYLPNIAFEVRHNFVLIKAIWENGMLSQGNQSIITKLNDLLATFLALPQDLFANQTNLLSIFLLFIVFFQTYRVWKNKVTVGQSRILLILTIIFVASLVLQLFSPVGVAKHYIFPILTILIMLLSFLELRFQVVIVLISFLIFSRSDNIDQYLSIPELPVSTMQNCAKQICAGENSPLMVSEQSSRHPYHSAWAYQFLLADAGCQVVPVEPNSTKANKMVVVLDNTSYEHGRTAYNELTQFGGSEVVRTYDCPDPLTAVILSKE